MIVCVCKAVCERELEQLVEAGAESPEQIERHCGAGGDCGSCRPDIERIIERITLRPPAPGSLPVLPPDVRV
jgi:assimilatory nitrate reductase catalytic subunit